MEGQALVWSRSLFKRSTTILNAAISEYKVDFDLPGRSLQDILAKNLHVLPLPGHHVYSQNYSCNPFFFPPSQKSCLSSLLMVCIGACNVHTTENFTYEVLNTSRSNVVFARHLQGVYLNWPLTINVIMQFLMKNKSSDNQSSQQVTFRDVACFASFFFSAVLPAASPPKRLFHAVFRRQRKLLTVH